MKVIAAAIERKTQLAVEPLLFDVIHYLIEILIIDDRTCGCRCGCRGSLVLAESSRDVA